VFTADGATPLATAVQQAQQAAEQGTTEVPQNKPTAKPGTTTKPANKPVGSKPVKENITTPMHEAAEATVAGGKTTSTKAQMNSELRTLARLLRKGRSIENFVAHVLPEDVVDAVAKNLTNGIDYAITKGDEALNTHYAIADARSQIHGEATELMTELGTLIRRMRKGDVTLDDARKQAQAMWANAINETHERAKADAAKNRGFWPEGAAITVPYNDALDRIIVKAFGQ
jgi:hypothetical protein